MNWLAVHVSCASPTNKKRQTAGKISSSHLVLLFWILSLTAAITKKKEIKLQVGVSTGTCFALFLNRAPPLFLRLGVDIALFI